jgi:IPT/TIG domain
MTVTALEPASSSPVKKTQIKISGTNFGSDKTKLKVFLVNADKTYELNVLSVTEGTNGDPDVI